MSEIDTTTPLDHAIALIIPAVDRTLSDRFGAPTRTQFEYHGEYFATQVRNVIVRARVPLGRVMDHDVRAVVKEVADAVAAKLSDTETAATALTMSLKLKQQCLDFESGATVKAPGDITLRHARALIDDDVASLVSADSRLATPVGEPDAQPNKAVKREMVKTK